MVGESGSGKSVTSLAVMGLLPQGILKIGAGSIRVEGEDVATATPRRLRELRATRMAMVFQEPMTALNPVHTVGKQVDEVLRLHRKMSAAERRAKVLEMFRSVHLPDVERIYDAYPHQLSGGQRQRIVIAMALILEPRLLIADEPTTALDVTTQKQILALIKELQVKHKTAVLFITHDFGVVADLRPHHRDEPRRPGRKRHAPRNPGRAQAVPRGGWCPRCPAWCRRAARPAGQPVLHVRVWAAPTAAAARCSRAPAHGVVAAADVNLTLRKGEILGIVGESGSGKSTVARCIVRLIEPTAGHMMMGGEDLSTLSGAALRPVRRRIQIVFQDPYRSLNPRRTVGESIIEGLLNFGVPREQALRRAGETLSVVGLSPDAMRRYPHQFSGGQRQRICIARALVMDPEILVADEAVSALDVSVQAQVLELLEQVRQRTGVGVLFITHDLRVAAQICDTIIVMQRGRLSRPAAPRPC